MRRRDADQVWWRYTLACGAVAVAVVGGLLEVLRRSVDDLDAAVGRLWTAGKMVAQNTQAAHLFETTMERTAALREQLGTPDGAKEPAG